MTDADVVRSFLLALQDRDLDAAMALLTEDAVWINVSLPAVRDALFSRRAVSQGTGEGRGESSPSQAMVQ